LRIDERGLDDLIVESQDIQSDAIRQTKATIADLRDVRADRRGQGVDPEATERYNTSRRDLLKRFGLGAGAVAGRRLVPGALGAAVAGIVASPAAADEQLDIKILQTAASLENLAVATYQAALGLPFIRNGNKTVVAFAQTTMMQHAEHGKAFNAQATALGGKAQTNPNPVYLKVVEDAKPTLKAPLDVVKLAASLEEVASDTYLVNTTQLDDNKSKEVMASVMGVEVQHLATLLAVQALLEGGAPQLIVIPTDLPRLPAAAGSVAFKDGAFLEASDQTVADPEQGAVK
jgi:rubrerythrin